MTARRFDFRFAAPYRLAALAFGVTPARCAVNVGSESLRVEFGPWRLETTLDNIADVSVTGPYAFIKTAGPPHLTFGDRGLTFASNGDRGVYVEFHEPVAGIEPTGRLRHPNLTVTVADVDGLAAALRRS